MPHVDPLDACSLLDGRRGGGGSCGGSRGGPAGSPTPARNASAARPHPARPDWYGGSDAVVYADDGGIYADYEVLSIEAKPGVGGGWGAPMGVLPLEHAASRAIGGRGVTRSCRGIATASTR